MKAVGVAAAEARGARPVEPAPVDVVELAVGPGGPGGLRIEFDGVAVMVLALAQREVGPMRVRDVDAVDQDARGRPGRVRDGLEHEIDDPFVGRRVGRGLHGVPSAVGNIGFAGTIDAVKQRNIALRRGVGQRVHYPTAEHLAVAHQPRIGGVDMLDDVVGAGQHCHEAGRPFEQFGEAAALGGDPALGLDPAGRLLNRAEHARDRAVVVADRRVGEGEPGALVVAAPVHGERQVLEEGRPSVERRIDQGRQVGPDLRPYVAKARTQRGRVLAPKDLGVGVVVEEPQIGSPGDEHRETRVEHQADGGAQRLRPASGRTQHRAGPAGRAHGRADLAAAGEERERVRVGNGTIDAVGNTQLGHSRP